jgi:preprotein translocase subunit SecG
LLTYTLFTIFILSCIVLIISVLLQPGKADAGALFTSSISSTAFGPRGTQTILAKITVVAAATFMIVALLLGMGVGSQRSLMEGAKAKATPTPAQQSPAPQGQASPAAPAQTDGSATAPAGGSNTSASPESKASPATK